MEIIDPGHQYHLRSLDLPEGHERGFQTLTFVKREGPGYPGNSSHHPGTTTQEVLRVLIDRAFYVDNQIADEANQKVIRNLREAIFYLEERAARRHGRPFPPMVDIIDGIEKIPTCHKCNHIGCEGNCH